MSAKPRRKISPQPHPGVRPQIRSRHLRMASPASSHSPRPSPARWAAALVCLGVLSYAWMIGRTYFATGAEWNGLSQLSALSTTFQNEGIEGYLLAKARLRENVRDGLMHQSPEAENIAVFLFPELLADTHFEKSESLALFAPAIETIENHPQSTRAREAWETLESEIWNYENASREEPELSAAATKLLQVLENLSRG